MLTASLFQKRLQDQRGGHLVHHFAMFLTGMAGLVENLMRLARGQPLIPQMDGQTGQLAQRGGKGLRFNGLRADVAREMHGIADHNARDAKATAEPRQRAQVLALIVLSGQRQNRLRREPKLVRHGHADAAIADIKTEIAGL